MKSYKNVITVMNCQRQVAFSNPSEMFPRSSRRLLFALQTRSHFLRQNATRNLIERHRHNANVKPDIPCIGADIVIRALEDIDRAHRCFDMINNTRKRGRHLRKHFNAIHSSLFRRGNAHYIAHRLSRLQKCDGRRCKIRTTIPTN